MPGKVVGAGWLNRAHLPHVVAGENFELRLMFIDKRGELETVHGLLPAQLGRQLNEAQHASSDAMSNKQRRQMCAGLDRRQGWPFPTGSLAEVGPQPVDRRMFHHQGWRELTAELLLDLN